MSIADDGLLEQQYNPRLRVPHFAEYFTNWKRRSGEALASLQVQLDLRYGPAAAETLDFFAAGGVGGVGGNPLLVFVHGGFWRALDKQEFAWIAPPYVAAGISVAVLNYGLAPATPMAEIVEQIRRACIWLRRNAPTLGVDSNRIVCAGHSAGGHLAAMMLATDWPGISPELPRRLLSGAVAFSGLFDLEPLTRAEFLRHDLQLDAAAARMLSPAFLPCRNDAPFVVAVGTEESTQFHRQSELIARHWQLECHSELLDVPGCNHYSICEAFTTPQSPLFQATCALFKDPP